MIPSGSSIGPARAVDPGANTTASVIAIAKVAGKTLFMVGALSVWSNTNEREHSRRRCGGFRSELPGMPLKTDANSRHDMLTGTTQA